VRREDSRYFRKKEGISERINELATHRKRILETCRRE
jgi:hypothetical protein